MIPMDDLVHQESGTSGVAFTGGNKAVTGSAPTGDLDEAFTISVLQILCIGK